jgi:hypothetical protein
VGRVEYAPVVKTIQSDTATAIVLNTLREHQVVLPARPQDVKPPAKKVGKLRGYMPLNKPK